MNVPSEVDAILQELVERIRSILGGHFIGMYLDGSIASGDFDQDSDIDFVVVTEDEIDRDTFLRLQAMHERIAAIHSGWAVQLEGSYISRQALRRYDPEHTLYPNIERGRGERLKLSDHDQAWNVHRYILRERGITLFGPSSQTLIDPVTPADLRQAMLSVLHGWAAHILDHPDRIQNRGYQSYVVLSLCRILYTLQRGEVASKPQAVAWVKGTTGEQWAGLIDRAWVGRHNPQITADPEDIEKTLDFIRFVMR